MKVTTVTVDCGSGYYDSSTETCKCSNSSTYYNSTTKTCNLISELTNVCPTGAYYESESLIC